MRHSCRISLPNVALFSGIFLFLATTLFAADNWTDASREFAAKILAHALSNRAVALSIRNISSLGEDDVSQIRRQLRAQIRSHGAQLTGSKHAGTAIRVTLSENSGGFIWVAEIQGGSKHEVAMMNVARPALARFHSISEPLSVRKTLLYSQAEPMLDVAFVENPALAPSGAATSILVLGVDSVSLYEELDQTAKGGLAWKLKQSAPVPPIRRPTRDPRGRLELGQNNSFNVYLPGEICSGVLDPALKLECRESDAPWPHVVSIAPNIAAYFNPERNFFDGRIQTEDGHALMASPFYSAALLPLKSGPLWLLSAVDGRVQLLNSEMDSMGSVVGWGSNIVVIQSNCQEAWQALATQPGDYSTSDAVQAIDVVDRKAVPAGASVEFDGPVMELWPLQDASAAIAISRNLKTSSYETFRLSITCGQ